MDFTPEGGVIEVRISVVENTSRNKQFTLQFAVVDSGQGMSQEQQQAVFSPSSRSRQREGHHGLGLAHSKELAGLMSPGKSTPSCGVISAVGKGSTFFLEVTFTSLEEKKEKKEFPIEEKKEAIKITETPTVVESPKTGTYSDLRVLVAEDNEILQKIELSFLKKLGCVHITIVSNGQEALDKCQTEKYDIIFSDVQMPVMDGLTAAGRIRKEGKNQGTMIVACTAGILQLDDLPAIQGVLEKPYKKDGVEQHLKKVLEANELAEMFTPIEST